VFIEALLFLFFCAIDFYGDFGGVFGNYIINFATNWTHISAGNGWLWKSWIYRQIFISQELQNFWGLKLKLEYLADESVKMISYIGPNNDKEISHRPIKVSFCRKCRKMHTFLFYFLADFQCDRQIHRSDPREVRFNALSELICRNVHICVWLSDAFDSEWNRRSCRVQQTNQSQWQLPPKSSRSPKLWDT